MQKYQYCHLVTVSSANTAASDHSVMQQVYRLLFQWLAQCCCNFLKRHTYSFLMFKNFTGVNWMCTVSFFATPISALEIIARPSSTQNYKQCLQHLRLWQYPDSSQSTSLANCMFVQWSCTNARKWLICICDPARENRVYAHKVHPFTLFHLSHLLYKLTRFCKLHQIHHSLLNQ